MNGFWLFVHYITFTIWLGGALSAMVIGINMKHIDRGLWGAAVDAQAAIYRVLIGPGAMGVILSGILLTFRMYGAMAGGGASNWMGTMQGAGVLGALVTLLGAMPAAAKLSRLEPIGAQEAAFNAQRKRLAIAGSVGGTLGLIALLASAFYLRP
jgi:hypothetical protein